MARTRTTRAGTKGAQGQGEAKAAPRSTRSKGKGTASSPGDAADGDLEPQSAPPKAKPKARKGESRPAQDDAGAGGAKKTQKAGKQKKPELGFSIDEETG